MFHQRACTQFDCIHFFNYLPRSNEREGIPAELIQLMDDCIEIPQFGTIRSLNVHVSASLLVWEYTRQHLVAAANS